MKYILIISFLFFSSFSKSQDSIVMLFSKPIEADFVSTTLQNIQDLGEVSSFMDFEIGKQIEIGFDLNSLQKTNKLKTEIKIEHPLNLITHEEFVTFICSLYHEYYCFSSKQ